MKRLRFLSGNDQQGTGNGEAIVPSGQVLAITMVPGAGGSWYQIDESKPIWAPAGYPVDLQAKDLGLCCGQNECDQWPGETQIRIAFGQEVTLPPGVDRGGVPQAWLVIYNGC